MDYTLHHLARLYKKTNFNAYKFLTSAYISNIGDTRYKFKDLKYISPKNRVPSSPIIQFYSSVDNIGNYTPVLGIQRMLGQVTDTWCIHDKNIDFEFINSHYKHVIIGGAGLMHKCFEHFWSRFLKECRLPTIVWGVGVCLPNCFSSENTAVSKQIINKVEQRCDLFNVRDDLTSDYYSLRKASISACPTIIYLSEFSSFKSRKIPTRLLSSWHEKLVSKEEQKTIEKALEEFRLEIIKTRNIQKPWFGLTSIINNLYCESKLVVTSRLHGAIIAYGLGVPYVAISKDKKIESFHRLYGNGFLIKHAEELKELSDEYDACLTKEIAIQPVLSFGIKAKEWLECTL